MKHGGRSFLSWCTFRYLISSLPLQGKGCLFILLVPVTYAVSSL
uniref:Uncharacterized protein n=1 Tax=Arundo donax TaxID=35708 RepID=A0A0A9DWR5_ARUDO